VYISEEDLVEPRLDIYHLHAMTGTPARKIYYYVQRRLVPKAIGSGPAARYNYGHVIRLKVIDVLKAKRLLLWEIKAFLDGHTDWELLGISEGSNPERSIAKMRRFFHRRAGESHDGADNLTRVEIREGIELFVSPRYLPRAAAKVDDLTRALDEILDIDDGT
jgi:DNA-binding transcriptional MerR regulator